ncbi:MAG: hypothetical protein UHS49_06305 [Faecalimonas sp.]|nr:hypothetical protein [Faecalimonas sp.]
MYVKAKKLAVAGLLAAFAAVLLVLSAMIETSSLFFIAAASFCVGIVIREWGLGFGSGFWIASTFVNLLVAPNKYYCGTYAAMGLYLLLSEALWLWLADRSNVKRRTLILWIGKYVIFNTFYLPAVFFLPQLLVAKKPSGMLWLVLVAAGQVALFVYDRAYVYFQGMVWSKLRRRLMKE